MTRDDDYDGDVLQDDDIVLTNDDDDISEECQ